jgi:diketogulonate reductase-like aldo/keto reductase
VNASTNLGPVYIKYARRTGHNHCPQFRAKNAVTVVLLAWAVQRGTAVLTTPKTPDRARENFDISILSADAMEQINAIQTRQRFNTSVPETGIHGFADFSRMK